MQGKKNRKSASQDKISDEVIGGIVATSENVIENSKFIKKLEIQRIVLKKIVTAKQKGFNANENNIPS